MNVGSGVWVGVGSGVRVGVCSGVGVGSGVRVGVGSGVAVGSGVRVGVGSGVAVGSGVWVGDGSGVWVGVVARSITVPNWSPATGGSVVGRIENIPAGGVGVSAGPAGASSQAIATSMANTATNPRKWPDARCPVSVFLNISNL